MLKLSRALALLAAIMLVIGGAPAVAATQTCNPCPPDCPMMQQMAAPSADHSKGPEKGKAENSCKQAVVCQAAAVSMAALSEGSGDTALSVATVDHPRPAAAAALSRPPDRTLRPPIQL